MIKYIHIRHRSQTKRKEHGSHSNPEEHPNKLIFLFITNSHKFLYVCLGWHYYQKFCANMGILRQIEVHIQHWRAKTFVILADWLVFFAFFLLKKVLLRHNFVSVCTRIKIFNFTSDLFNWKIMGWQQIIFLLNMYVLRCGKYRKKTTVKM